MATRQSRKQNSSCDACRKLRIGCDVRTKDEGEQCSNCKRRGRECTLHHVFAAAPRKNKRSTVAIKDESAGIHPEGVDTGPFDSNTSTGSPDTSVSRQSDLPSFSTIESGMLRHQQALRLHSMLWEIFSNRFETQIGIWIGSACCPFENTVTAPIRLISRLMLTLTSRRRRLVDPQLSAMIETVQALSPAEEEGLRQALVSAVHAFSARWLPSPDAPSSPSTQLAAASKSKEELMHNLWIRAHSKVYATIHRASYALILALHLFGHTPAPPGIVEPNSGDLCLQVSLQHVRTLSSQAHLISQSESSKVVVSNTIDDSFRTDVSPTDYSQMEEIAYWFGIMCDASRSMMKCQPPIVNDSPTSDSKIWDLVRAEVDEFHRKNVHYRNSRVPIPVEVLYGIVGYGNACTSMFWSAISRVQDALFHHRTGISVEEATRVALQEMTRFSKSFEWLLGFVKRDFVLLNEKIRVSCCLLDVDFSLGVMTLVDLLSATSYAHLLPSEYELRLTSARELANSARIAVHLDMTSLGSPLENSILLQSPYPEYIVNAFYRAGMSTIHLYKTKSISLSMVEVSLSLICQGLRILQIVSYAAHSTYKTLQNMCDEVGIKPRPTPAFTTDALLAYESQSFAANGNDMFTRQTVQELDNITTSDNTLLEATIQKHERALGLI